MVKYYDRAIKQEELIFWTFLILVYRIIIWIKNEEELSEKIYMYHGGGSNLEKPRWSTEI